LYTNALVVELNSTWQMGYLPAVNAGGDGVAASVPVITETVPAFGSNTTRSMRGLVTGAVKVGLIRQIFTGKLVKLTVQFGEPAPAASVTVFPEIEETVALCGKGLL
jgi:hypothetical protein